jgi:hypothetical protein
MGIGAWQGRVVKPEITSYLYWVTDRGKNALPLLVLLINDNGYLSN